MPEDILVLETEAEVIEETEPPDYTNALKKVYDWFSVDREAKSDYIDEMAEMYKLYNGKHWDLLDDNGAPLRTADQKKARPNTVENVTFALIEGLVAEFSGDIELLDYPVEQGDEEKAKIMGDLKEFLAYKNRINKEKAKWLRWFFLYGTGIWHTYWDPTWRGGKGPNRWAGDIRWKALHPQALFPDARCLESLEDGRRVTKAFYKTQEYVQEKYGVDVASDLITADMLVGDEAEDILTTEMGEERVLLCETWYKGEPLFLGASEQPQGYGLHVVWWAGDTSTPTYLAHANYVYYDPGEDCYFPFMIESCYPRENSIWGFGEAYFMKSPQVVRNKTSELILEAHLHHALGQTFFDPNAVDDKQLEVIRRYGTLAGMWFPMLNPQGVKREYGRGAPESLLKETERLQKVMESIVGRFDISQGRTPGSVTAFKALDLLAERAQTRLRSKEKSLIGSYEECGNYMNNLIARYYTERRAYRILGKENSQKVWVNTATGQRVPEEQLPPGFIPQPPEWVQETDASEKPAYGIFRNDMLKKAYVFGTGESYPLDEFQPVEGMIEGEHYEIYCAEFDTMCRVTTSMPTDRMFYMEMAKELFAARIIDEETFYYVIDRGKFPPWEEMMEKARQKAQMMQQQAQTQQGVQPTMEGQLPQGLPGQQALAQQIGSALEADPSLKEKFFSLNPQQQAVVLSQMMAGGGGSAVI